MSASQGATTLCLVFGTVMLSARLLPPSLSLLIPPPSSEQDCCVSTMDGCWGTSRLLRGGVSLRTRSFNFFMKLLGDRLKERTKHAAQRSTINFMKLHVLGDRLKEPNTRLKGLLSTMQMHGYNIIKRKKTSNVLERLEPELVDLSTQADTFTENTAKGCT